MVQTPRDRFAKANTRKLIILIILTKIGLQGRQSLSPRVAVLDCNIGWTRRGLPFWDENKSEGTMVPSCRVQDLILVEAVAAIK